MAPGEPPAMPGLMRDLCGKAAAVGYEDWRPAQARARRHGHRGGRVVEDYTENGDGAAINPDGSITFGKEWIGNDDGTRASLDEILVKAQKPKRRRKRKKGEAVDGGAEQSEAETSDLM
jgi:hypothetical protein